MVELIEPAHFDAVVISSGLVEVLIGSALARAGKAVLVLDPADNYGASWASLSAADFVHQLINKGLTGYREQQDDSAGQAHPQSPPPAAASRTADAGSLIPVHARQQPGGMRECTVYTHPDLEQAIGNKGLIVDLAPRALYQDEALVRLLVACQAHHYLEFKLVEGNYVYLDGMLQPVPASRADLFADRSLSLADKRSLGRFIAGCTEAAEGSGRLMGLMDSRPLVDVLAAEGLNERLQQLVLYGIAMADVPQPPHTGQQLQQQPPSTQPGPPPTCSVQQREQELSQEPQQQQQQQQQVQLHQQQWPCRVTSAAEGLSAFVQYSQSLGKYGGSGALMAPCYGCGSLVEAFVRLAAVKGAVTALRHGTQHLQLLPQQPSSGGDEGAAGAAADGQTAAAGGAAQQQDSPPAAAPCSSGAGSTNGSPQPPAAAAAAGGPVASSPARVQLTLTNDQVITAGSVICDSRAVSTPACSGSSSQHSTSSTAGSGPCGTTARDAGPTAGPVCVARAVAVLRGSLMPDVTSLVLVLPPGSLGPQQAAVIRGLQLGAALAVAPPGHSILYLAAVLPEQATQQQRTCAQQDGDLQPQQPQQGCAAAIGNVENVPGGAATPVAGVFGHSSGLQLQTAAELVLGPALTALADTTGLTQLTAAGPEPTQAHGSSSQEGTQQQGACPGPGQQQPQVLAACFYSLQQDPPQTVQQQQELGQAGAGHCAGSCVLTCPPAPAAGFTGYTASIAAAEALFRQHFPGLPWLTDATEQRDAGSTAAADGGSPGDDATAAAAASTPEAAAAGGEGAAAGPMDGDDDDDLDAIDELTAALMELSSGLDSMPGQGSTAQQQL